MSLKNAALIAAIVMAVAAVVTVTIPLLLEPVKFLSTIQGIARLVDKSVGELKGYFIEARADGRKKTERQSEVNTPKEVPAPPKISDAPSQTLADSDSTETRAPRSGKPAPDAPLRNTFLPAPSRSHTAGTRNSRRTARAKRRSMQFAMVNDAAEAARLFSSHPGSAQLFDHMSKSVWVFGARDDATRQIVPLWRDAENQGLEAPSTWKVAVVYLPAAWTPQRFEEHMERWISNSDSVRREDIMQWSSILLPNGTTINLCRVGGICIVVTSRWRPRAFSDFNLWSDKDADNISPTAVGTMSEAEQGEIETQSGNK